MFVFCSIKTMQLMKKVTIPIFTILCLYHLCSCRPGNYREEQIQHHDDSIKQVMKSKYSSKIELSASAYTMNDVHRQ
jgi:hypothetical protein